MKTYFYSITICVFACNALYAEEMALNNKQQMKTYAIKHCQLDQVEECECIADNIVDRFSEKDWKIFVAAINKDESIKQQVSEKDIFNFSDKIYEASASCGIE